MLGLVPNFFPCQKDFRKNYSKGYKRVKLLVSYLCSTRQLLEIGLIFSELESRSSGLSS